MGSFLNKLFKVDERYLKKVEKRAEAVLALEEEYIFVMPKALRLFSKIIFLLGIVFLILGIKEVKHIFGGIIIILLGLHFALIDDVGKKEE